MRFHLYSPISIDPWGPDQLDEVGGNEQGVAQMAWRLAERGHEVNVYTRVPWNRDDSPKVWGRVNWYGLESADFTDGGLWVLYRCPEISLQLPVMKMKWLVVQDFEYDWGGESFDGIDRVLMTCHTHQLIIARRYPELAERLFLTRNGTKVELFDDIEDNEKVRRDPHRIMFASSPDRGLRLLIDMFSKAREFVPDLSLHVYYGFNGIDRITEQSIGGWPSMQKEKARILMAAEQTPGVVMHGRVSQRELYRAWLQSALMVAPSDFREMSYITGQEAQCGGAIPIVNPFWGQGDQVKHGVFIIGDASYDPLVRARYASAIIQLASDHDLQKRIRQQMIPDSRDEFNWERVADQWERWAHEDLLDI